VARRQHTRELAADERALAASPKSDVAISVILLDTGCGREVYRVGSVAEE